MNDTRPDTFDPQKLERITIFQGLDNGKTRPVYNDEITVADAMPTTAEGFCCRFEACRKGYDRHIDLTWAPVQGSELQFYKIYRSLDGKTFITLATQHGERTRLEDFPGASGKSASCKVWAVNSSYKESALTEAISGGTRAMSG